MKLNFFVPTRIIMDIDCVEKNADSIASLGNNVFIVTGAQSSRDNGSLVDLCKTLSANGQSYVLFDKVMSNPTIDCVYEGAALAKNTAADCVIAVGGGSPMDAAKVIALLACEDIPREKLFAGEYKKRLPLCCVPTTAGTGSEVTQYAILTNDAAQTKTSLASPLLFPDLSLLDSKYLSFASKNVMTNTVIDAFSHSVEGYLSVRANAISDVLALEAIAVISGLFSAIADWNLTDGDREKLLYASALGGMVIAHTGTTAVHSMGYSLTYFKNIDHGRANGLLLGEFLKFVEEKRPDRIAPIIKAAGFCSTYELGEVLDKLLGKREEVEPDEVEKFSAISIKAKNIPNCIVVPDEADLINLYRLSFGLEK